MLVSRKASWNGRQAGGALSRRSGVGRAVTVSLPDRRRDGPVGDPEGAEHMRLVQGLETRLYPVPGPTRPRHQVVADPRPRPVIRDPPKARRSIHAA